MGPLGAQSFFSTLMQRAHHDGMVDHSTCRPWGPVFFYFIGKRQGLCHDLTTSFLLTRNGGHLSANSLLVLLLLRSVFAGAGSSTQEMP